MGMEMLLTLPTTVQQSGELSSPAAQGESNGAKKRASM